MIDFINSKSSHELRTMDIEDKTTPLLEINKMAQKNLYREKTKENLGKIKESVLKFNIYFDKRMRA